MAGRRFAAEGALVVAAALFGVTFLLIQSALEDVTPAAFLVLRFAIAVAVLAPFAWVITMRRGEDRRMLVRVGLVAGVLLFGGFTTQTLGLQYTSASTSAFLTGLYVILTPMVVAAQRRRWPGRRVFASGAVATAGLYLLTGADLALGRGELLTLACAVLFAVWIVYQGDYAARFHPIPFTTMQMGAIVLIGIPAMARQGIGELSPMVWFAIVFTGIACSAVALSLQLWGQRRIPATRAALILLLEPVFALVASVGAGERLGAVELAGAALILVAIAFAELGGARLGGARLGGVSLGRQRPDGVPRTRRRGSSKVAR